MVESTGVYLSIEAASVSKGRVPRAVWEEGAMVLGDPNLVLYH